MKKIIRFIKSLYFSPNLYFIGGAVILLFILGYVHPPLFEAGKFAFFILIGLVVADLFLLYRDANFFFARRDVPEKLSNGDENLISIYLENRYLTPVYVKLADEAPDQFQRRDIEYSLYMPSGASRTLQYKLRPTRRGTYSFGAINCYVSSPLRIVQRRMKFTQDTTVPVYPSFMQMRQYELLAISSRLTMIGIKKIRRIGQNMEFDQIRDYVMGDDPRTVNWKATARRSRLMVNQYQDEKAQPVYSVIDMGRVMRSPFMELTLLDYAINASLVISNIAILKNDKAGIITFSHRTDAVLKAERASTQMFKILELLYRQKTGFLESNFESLYAAIKRKINQRSLIILYTNFESLSSMHRQLPYLRRIHKSHLLVVVFFMNAELKAYTELPSATAEDVYLKTIARKFAYEKRQIVKELKAYGIQSVLTTPENLTVNVINKYLELKARGMI